MRDFILHPNPELDSKTLDMRDGRVPAFQASAQFSGRLLEKAKQGKWKTVSSLYDD